jgi:hypothetical protein
LLAIARQERQGGGIDEGIAGPPNLTGSSISRSGLSVQAASIAFCGPDGFAFQQAPPHVQQCGLITDGVAFELAQSKLKRTRVRKGDCETTRCCAR